MFIESRFLNVGFDFPDRRDEVPTTHDILDMIISEQTTGEPHYVMLCHDQYRSAILCIITDENGRRTEGVGECSFNSVRGSKAENFPVGMAAKRAFDHAAIRFLKFPAREFKSMYDDAEDNPEPASTQQQNPQKQSGGYSRQPQNDQGQYHKNGQRQQGSSGAQNRGNGQTQNRQSAPARQQGGGGLADEFDQPPARQQYGQQSSRSAPRQQSRSGQQQSVGQSQTTQGDYTRTLVTVGRCKGREMTIADVAREDPESIQYIAYDYPERHPPTTAEKKTLVDNCRRWIEEHGNAA